MTKKKDQKDYQKPELVHIDNPAFDEKGQGASGLGNPGTIMGDRGNGKGKGNAGGNNSPGIGGNGPKK